MTTIVFFRDEGGRVPFLGWFNRLSGKAKIQCRARLQLLAERSLPATTHSRGGPVTRRRRTTTDGLEILDRLHFRGRPARVRALADATLNARIAQEIHALRIRAGLTQKQLAMLVGTTDSAISRLEDAAYAGHSLKMLQRISAVLNRRLEIHFAPIRAPRKRPA